MSASQVYKNEDGTWHAPGVPTAFRLKREAEAALRQHQQELQQAREAATAEPDPTPPDEPPVPAETLTYVPRF